MKFCSPRLPIPDVLKIGEALGFEFAISRRHFGHFIETIPPQEAAKFSEVMTDLLAAMRCVKSPTNARVIWYDDGNARNLTWHAWLLSGLVDDADAQVAGWREEIADDSSLNFLFEQCENRINELLPLCPERRDLVHGDLLHQNVLVSGITNDVSAVFSWKCSVLGDFLSDIAWCTFWSDWHPVIASGDLWKRSLLADDLNEIDLHNASSRHHCYELQIAASHIGWFIWTNDQENLTKLVTVTEKILARGPLAISYL